MRMIWYLLEDLMDQPILVKMFIGWAWLSVLIMLAGLASDAIGRFGSAALTYGISPALLA